MVFEYDEAKNLINIRKHGISFRSAARVFFDYDRIELYDEENSAEEDRYDTIGDVFAGGLSTENTIIGNVNHAHDAILFVVYTERTSIEENGKLTDITRIISARMATSFERGLYYGKLN
ncbi:MAG: BrnT family toxin [Clostridia bacterium]|nr:BrnT family toxin [Clostridia bacterium]